MIRHESTLLNTVRIPHPTWANGIRYEQPIPTNLEKPHKRSGSCGLESTPEQPSPATQTAVHQAQQNAPAGKHAPPASARWGPCTPQGYLPPEHLRMIHMGACRCHGLCWTCACGVPEYITVPSVVASSFLSQRLKRSCCRGTYFVL